MTVAALHFVNSFGLEELKSFSQIARVTFLHLWNFSLKSLLLEELGYLLLIRVTGNKTDRTADLLPSLCVALLFHNIIAREFHLCHLLVVEVKQFNPLPLSDALKGDPVSEVALGPLLQGFLRERFNRPTIALSLLLNLVFRGHQETVHAVAEGRLPLVNRAIESDSLLHLGEVRWVDRPELLLAFVAEVGRA